MKNIFMSGMALLKSNGSLHIFRIMRLTIYLLLLFTSFIFAENAISQNARVNLNKSKAILKEVLEEIELQTDYLFISNLNVDLGQKVSVKANDKPVQEVLNELLKNTNLTYSIEGVNIVLSKKNGSEVNQQTRKKITGIIKDPQGEPIIGANVVEKGTANGIITDMDGRFQLEVSQDAILVVSYIGYDRQEVPVRGDNLFDIVLTENIQALEEVVVIGYGTVKKKDLTGAVASIKGDALASRKVVQLSTALQGAIPGVMVTNPANTPEGASTIRVRGITTIGTTDPLYIIDGVPGDLSDVNANDVESISILKDAASASIYGSRAAAGVILVTTKRAKENTFNLNYSYEYGGNKLLYLFDYADVPHFLEMANELRYNDNPSGGWYQTYTEDQVNNWMEYNKTDPDHYPSTNWTEVCGLGKVAPQQTHSINISGGTKRIRTKASFTSDQLDGFYEGRSYKRYMIRVNNDIEINKFISASLDFNVKRVESQRPIYNPRDNRNAIPVNPALFSDGRYGDGAVHINPYAQMKQSGDYNEWRDQIGGKGSIDINPVDGLKISGTFSVSYNYDKAKTFKKAIPYESLDNPGVVLGYYTGWASTKLTEERNDGYKGTIQFLANYMKTFGKHDLNLTAGYENYHNTWENLSASRDQYVFDKYPYLDLGPLDYRDNSGSANEYAYRSYFGRAMYSYADKYLFQFNFRSDGSSRFRPDYRWGYFPSVSAGWVMSEEKFLKNSSADWLSFLKLRASWGELGNERLSSYYPTIGVISFSNALFYQNGVASAAIGTAQYTYVIPSLTWEKTESYDVGIDANFFNNRLQFSGDYYKKTTKDMLLSLEIPDYVGYDNPQQNTGKMNTTGWEFSLAWQDYVGDWNYSVSFNLSDFKSVMGDLGGTEFLGDQVKKQGSEFNEWYGYRSDGLFLTQEDVDNSPKLNANIGVGDIKYLDISGPDGVPDGKVNAEYDRVLLGGSLPKYMYGATLNMGYKNWDASVVIQGVGSQNVRTETSLISGGYGFNNTSAWRYGKYWSAKKTDEENAKAQLPRLTEKNEGSNQALSDYWLFNGRYLRLKNVMLGYTLPQTWTQKISIESLRFYFSANNLFCLDKYPKGVDPESITKNWLLGVSVNF